MWTVAVLLISVGVVVVALAWKRKHDEESERKAVQERVPGAEQWAGKRVCVVVNPIGGAGHGKRVYEKVLKPMLTHAGITIDLIGNSSISMPNNFYPIHKMDHLKIPLLV